MSLISSIANPIMFKDLKGNYPNWLNTLHDNRKQGVYKIIHYHQRFPKNETVYLQFSSDTSDALTLKGYYGATEITTGITVKAMATIAGDTTRYYFSCSIVLGSSYYDKEITFKAVQGSFTLTSEPVLIEDIATDLANGSLKQVKYTNLDRDYSELQDFFVYWEDLLSTGSYFQFYIDCVDKELNDSDEVEILEGSQSKDIISSQQFAGINLKTGIIPDYMVRRLKVVSSMDVFLVNGVQYIKDSSAESENVGNSTSHQLTLKLTEKNALSINVDDLGVTDFNNTEMITNQPFTDKSTDFDTEIPAGYMVHEIFAEHAPTSTGTAVLTSGLTSGSDLLIDAIQGTFTSAAGIKMFPVHYPASMQEVAGRLYFGISGAGVKLNISVNFIKII